MRVCHCPILVGNMEGLECKEVYHMVTLLDRYPEYLWFVLTRAAQPSDPDSSLSWHVRAFVGAFSSTFSIL